MFIPRALRLKGVTERPRPKASQHPRRTDETNSEKALTDAMEGISTGSPKPQEEPGDVDMGRGPRFTTRPVTSEYLAQLVAGMELIFSDYAHQEEERCMWLQKRYRTVDGEENCAWTASR